jgi:hypothetical protein
MFYVCCFSFDCVKTGSMAFMRAVNEDPPMQPIFSEYYHLQSDELMGSWLLLLSCVPIIPYSLLYLATDKGNLEYLGALAISFVMVFGCSLFVMCCYPSDKVSADASMMFGGQAC